MGQGPAPAVSMAEATLGRVWREEGLVCRPGLCHLAAQLLLAPFIYCYRHGLLVQQNPDRENEAPHIPPCWKCSFPTENIWEEPCFCERSNRKCQQTLLQGSDEIKPRLGHS